MNTRKSVQLKGNLREEMTVRKSKSLKSGRHQIPEQHIQSKRGRGRPKRSVVSVDSKDRCVNFTKTNGDLVVTLDNCNETLPHLVRQTMDIDDRINVGPNLNQSEGMGFLDIATIPAMNEAISRGQTCSRYLKACKEFTQKIERQGLEKENLVTVLKYALLKCNLGDIDLSLSAIKSASDDMSVGISWDIENPITNARHESQTNDSMDKRTHWNGRVYTPQLEYD